jgi:sulfane dehydrogenase subunit SoxC
VGTEIRDHAAFRRNKNAQGYVRSRQRGPARAESHGSEISTDGGKNWKEAKIQGPVHSKAHTRFTYDWAWDGQEAVLQSRCTDETGDVQPSLAELGEHWEIPMADWKKAEKPRSIHMNAIQPWKVARDGSITDAMFA